MLVEDEMNGGDARLAAISASIRVVPNFPKPGINFNDIMPLFLQPKVFKDTVEIFVERYREMRVSAIAGVEARGFLFGPPIALAIGAKFIPLQKPKKLPGGVISESYALEYGNDSLEMQLGAVEAGECVVIIDDVVATGGTLCAAIKLIVSLLLERAGAEVVECACVIGVPKFKDRCKLNGKPVFVLVEAIDYTSDSSMINDVLSEAYEPTVGLSGCWRGNSIILLGLICRFCRWDK